MFRILLLALLCAFLTYQEISALDIFAAYKKRKMSNKAQFMSNVSMVLYWALRDYVPIEMVPDKNEWLKIDGGVEDYPSEEFSLTSDESDYK